MRTHPRFLKRHHSVAFLADSIKVIIIGGIGAHDFESVLAGQEKHTVTLQPGPPGTDDNVMVGQFAMNAASGLRIVVLIQLPGKPSIVARFAF